MQGVLLRLVLLVLVPLLVVQAGIYVAWYYTRWSEQTIGTLETAREAGATFEAFIRDVHRQELAIGAALCGPHQYSPEEANAFLATAGETYVAVHSWMWASSEGRVMASNEEKAVGLQLDDQPYFQTIRGDRSWCVSSLLTDPISNTHTFVIITRIDGPKGAFAGAIAAVVDVKELGERAVALNHTVGEAVALFDAGGVLVYNSQQQRDAFQDWRNRDSLLARALQSGEVQSGVIKLVYDDQTQEKVMAARVPLPGIGWVAGARRPVASAMESVYTGLWVVAGLNFLVVIVSGGLSWKTGGRLIGRLRRLQSHVQAIERGDFDHTAESNGVRELDELAIAFNRMGAAVRATHDMQEQSLLEQSRILDAFFRHTFTSLVILDRDFNFIHVNEAYAQSCQREINSFLGHNHFELYPHAENEAIFRNVVGTKKPYQVVAKPFDFPDHPEWGTTYWDWNLVPILNKAGEVDFLVFSLNDVTARKRIEQELRAASLYARGLIEASLDPLVTISREGKITDVNKATETVTGVPRDHLIGSEFSRYFTEPDLASDGYRRVLSDGFVRDYPLTIRHVLGHTCEVLYNAVVYRNEAGDVEGVFAAARDVTDRRRIERELDRYRAHLEELVQQRTAQLEAANSQLQTVFDVVNVGMLLIDENGAVQRVNDTVSRWIGRDVSAHRQHQPGDIVGCIHAVGNSAGCGLSDHCRMCALRNAFTSVLQSGQPIHDVEAETTLLIDGSEVRLWLEISVDPVVLDGRRHVILAMNNITARKKAEEVLRRTTDELARSNEELQQFAYVASHDLQEPLRVVTGYVQLLERKYKSRLDADAEKFLHYIVDGVERMQQLINDLLNYSRVGTRGAAFRPINSQSVLDRVLANLKAVVEETGAAVTHDPLPIVQGDETQLVQLFQNIIGNGIKFRGDRTPHIHLSAHRQDGCWEFAVRDNGIGIEQQYWEQIFVIFQRLHTRHKYPGTGIGLAICKRIVERHGGRIWLESQPGQGTTFHFTLP